MLDLAAGQGNFSLALAERGYRVTWNDLRGDLEGYVRLKLDSVRSYVARLIASICGLRELSPEAQAVDAIVEAWAQRRGIVYSEEATPPGERSPLHVGITLPSAETRRHQPRKSAPLENEPVRHRGTQRLPSRSNFEPKAYSW